MCSSRTVMTRETLVPATVPCKLNPNPLLAAAGSSFPVVLSPPIRKPTKEKKIQEIAVTKPGLVSEICESFHPMHLSAQGSTGANVGTNKYQRNLLLQQSLCLCAASMTLCLLTVRHLTSPRRHRCKRRCG